MASKLWFASRQALNVSTRVVRADRPPVPTFSIQTSSSGLLNGSGRSRTALTMLNIAVHAPIPRASVRSATVVNPGAATSWRTANLSVDGMTCG